MSIPTIYSQPPTIIIPRSSVPPCPPVSLRYVINCTGVRVFTFSFPRLAACRWGQWEARKVSNNTHSLITGMSK